MSFTDRQDDARSQLRRLGEYLITVSAEPVDVGDALASLALPLHGQDSGERRSDDMLRLARLAKREYMQRARRVEYFPNDLFADPAWDMLLDLFICRAAGARVSVTSLCIASQVPATTALRWIRQCEVVGLVCRIDDPLDQRRSFIELTEKGLKAMTAYFRDLQSRLRDFSRYDVPSNEGRFDTRRGIAND